MEGIKNEQFSSMAIGGIGKCLIWAGFLLMFYSLKADGSILSLSHHHTPYLNIQTVGSLVNIGVIPWVADISCTIELLKPAHIFHYFLQNLGF